MQETLIVPPLSSQELEVSPNLNIVIAYEDFEAGKEAKRTCDFLNENLGADWRCANQMWKFEVLNIPGLREMAAKDAVMADIIIVSSRSGGVLPDSVKTWIELWLEAKTNAIALVALSGGVPGDEGPTRAIRAYLAGVAQRGQMEFFAQPVNWPANTKEEEPLPLAHARTWDGKTLFALAEMAQHETSFPRWGINE